MLLVVVKGLEGCGRILDAHVIRLLIDILDVWDDRSPWSLLSPLIGQGKMINLGDYVRLLAAGANPITEFWRSQIALLPDIVNLKEGLVVCVPTSAGKTRLAEVAIANELMNQPDKKVAYIVPTRALAAEVEKTFSLRLGPLGVPVSALYGGYELSEFEKLLLDVSKVLVLTPEKLDLLMRRSEGFVSKLCLVVVDEGHLVGEGERGLRLEFILSRIRWLGVRHGVKFLFLSAVLPNGEELAKWLTGAEHNSRTIDWKPTRTRQFGFFWGRRNPDDGQLHLLEDIPSEIEPFVPGLVNRTNVKSRDDVLIRLAIHFANVGPTMVFTITKKRVEQIADLIRQELSKRKIATVSSFQDKIDDRLIPVLTRTLGARHPLTSVLKHGLAFHHGALPSPVRRPLEEAVRSGWIQLVVANETLASGVNLPIRNILVDTVNRGGDLMAVRDFANVVGRAARGGKDIESNVIYMPDDNYHYPTYIDSFVEFRLEPCESVVLSTLLASVAPSYREWALELSMLIQKKLRTRFVNPWLIMVEQGARKLAAYLGPQTAEQFELAIKEALADRLKPTYSYTHWSKDRWTWKEIFYTALRSCVERVVSMADLADIDKDIYSRLHEVIDSQIIAMTMEEILNPDDPDSPLKFVPFTLIGAHKIASDELKKAYAGGLRQRFFGVLNAIPDADVRRKYSKTGLSVRGNLYLDQHKGRIKTVIEKWLQNQEPWDKVLQAILQVVDAIPDLKPQKGLKRDMPVMIAWVEGKPITQIARQFLEGDLSKATRVTEISIGNLLPWGVNSLFELLTEKEFDPRELSPVLRNLPAMLAFGVPTPFAAYAYALGVQDREIAQSMASYYFSSLDDNSKKEFSFTGFVKWFSELHEHLDQLEEISSGDRNVLEIMRNASELKSVGLSGKTKKGFIQIPKKQENQFAQGEEVILFRHKKSKNGKWMVLDYLNQPRFDCEIPKPVESSLQELDWIAKWDKTAFGTQIDITFVG